MLGHPLRSRQRAKEKPEIFRSQTLFPADKRLYKENMSFVRWSRVVLPGLLALLLPRCSCEDELGELRPHAQITPELIDMGNRVVGQSSTAFFTVGNIGSAPVNLSYTIAPLDEAWRAELGPDFVDADGNAFSVADAPATVMAQRSVDGHVAFLPTTQGRFAATLVVRTDDLDRPELRLPVIGRGGPPEIQANPQEVDFGVVNEGPGAGRTVKLQNIGFDTLHIDRVSVRDVRTDGGTNLVPVFSLVDPPAGGAEVEVGAEVFVQVRMDPNEEALLASLDAALHGVLVVESDAENAPVLEVPLFGTPNLAPRAAAVELATRRTVVKVGLGQDVIIDGNDTTDPEGDPFVFAWELVERPAGSDAFLVGALIGADCAVDEECEWDDGYRCIEGSTTGRCRQVARTRVKPDIVGTYRVRLTATDSRGAVGTAEVTILPRDLSLVLTWGVTDDATCFRPGSPECEALSSETERRLYCCGQTDIDLHLVRPGGGLGDYGACPASCTVDNVNQCFEDSDANVSACRQFGSDCAYANRYPEWGMPGRADDPRLDIDDPRGFGPESITLNEPEDGAYTAVVHFCLDRIGEPTLATLDVYVKGELRHTAGPQRLDTEGEAWVAATLLREGGPQDGTWTFVSVPDVFDPNVPAGLCEQ